MNELKNNKNIITKIAENVYTQDTVLEDLMRLDECTDKEEYNRLMDKIINVGEYPLEHPMY